jgi:predicted MFS family arabinose efflux permease
MPTSRTHWVAVLAAAGVGVASALNVGKVPLALGELRQEFGLSLVQAGWVSSMLTSLAIVAALATGLSVGRIGALRMVMGGLLLGAVASARALVAPGFGLLITSRFFEGAGFMAATVAGPALISAAAATSDRRFALGIWSSYMPAGAGLAMALSPWVLPSAGWRGLWLLSALALCGAAAWVWSQRARYATPQPVEVQPLRQALGVLRQPLPWLLSLSFSAWALQHFALIVWLPTFLREQRGMGPGLVAGLSAVMLLANVPGNLLGGSLVQRGVARGWLIAIAHTLTGLCGWGLFSDALPDGPRYALCVALSFIGGLIPAAVMSSSTVLARNAQQIGALQGLIMQCSQLGQFVGTPLIASVVAASGQWSSARWVTGTAAALGLLLGLAAWRAEQRLATA